MSTRTRNLRPHHLGAKDWHVVIYSDASTRGGAEAAAATLVGALDPVIRVTVMGVDAGVCEWIAARRPGTSTVIVEPLRSRRNVRELLAHRRAIRRLRPDVFQAVLTWMPSCQWPLLVASTIPGVKTIAVQNSPLGARSRRIVALERLVSKRLSAHIAVSDSTARAVESVLGLTTGSVRTIRNGVADVPVSTRARLFESPTVGTIARLDEHKGVDLLLRALVELPGVHAVVVGGGPAESQLQREAVELGIAERVVFTGWDDEPRGWLPTFDVFVLPSRLEGLPLSIIEAMLASRPVVATDVGGVRELVDDESGIVVPPDDAGALARAVKTLIDDPARRTALGDHGRTKAAAHFTDSAMARSYEALYSDVVDRR